MSQVDIIRVRKDEESEPYRTSIEDLSAVGYELSEEHLRLVVGGQVPDGGPRDGPSGKSGSTQYASYENLMCSVDND